MPQVIIAAAAYAAAGGAASAVLFAGITVAQVAAVAALTVFQAVQAKRARAKARQQFNDSLRDRLQMIDLQPDAPRTLVLGRVRCVEGIRRRWATGEHDKRLTLVVSFAGHEIDAFETFYFNDKPVELNAEGWVITDPWLKTEKEARWAEATFGPDGLATVTTGAPLVEDSASVISGQGSGAEGSTVTHTITGTTATSITASGPPGVTATFSWQESTGTPKVRIRAWRGAPGQNVGAELASEYPGKISAGDRFEGMAVAVVDLDYDEDVFPQGPPNITAVVRGAKILDPRTGVTAWSDNSALCANYYARYAQGWALPADVIRTSDVIAAANESDIATTFTVRQADDSTTTVTLPRYRCGIVIPDGSDPREAMDDIMDTMAGKWGWAGGTWRFRAGVSAAPVFALTPDWVAQRLDAQGEPVSGAVVKISNGVAREGKLNTITGNCVDSEQRWQVLPFPAVVDEVLVAREGEYPAEVSYPGVVHVAHAQHLSAIRIREAQAALRLQVSCNFSAYETELFDCGTVILPRYGMTEAFGKVAEVVGWRWHPTEGVSLQLAETSAAIYEPGELKGVDPAPDSSFPSPFQVPAVNILSAESGTAQLLRNADGTLISRIRLTWTDVGDEAVRNGGGFDIRYGPLHVDPAAWAEVSVRGDASEAYLSGVQDGWWYGIVIRARNSLVRGQWSRRTPHQVLGKTAPPQVVESITYEITRDGVAFTVPQNPEPDRAVTELRVGGLDWASSVPLVGSEPTQFAGTTFVWPRPAAGIYRVYARYIDTSGNYSPGDAIVDVVVTTADSLLWTEIVGRPRTWRVGAVGYLVSGSTIGPGFFNGETGAQIGTIARSWALMAIRRDDDQVVFGPQYYDVFSEGTDASNPLGFGRGSLALATDLNALGANVWAVVATSDEPANNRLSGGLPDALRRIGARSATLEALAFRGAYVCVGVPGVGEGGAIYEGVRNGATAWIDLSFQTYRGQVLGVSAADGAVNSALALAANAKATADGKIDTFYQPDPPPTAGEGDLWFDTNDGRKVYVRSAFGVWEPADDTRIADAISAAAGAQATADGKITTFYSASVPTAEALGDLWFNTASGRSYLWNGGAWVLVTTVGAGDITTGNLAVQAATAIYAVAFTDVPITGAPGVGGAFGGPMSVAGGLTFVAPATGEVLITADAVATTAMPSGVSAPTGEYHVVNTAWLVNGAPTGGEKRRHGPDTMMQPADLLYVSLVRTMRISVVEGGTYTVQLVAQAPQYVFGAYPIDQRITGEMRAEMIKR